ncbi:MBL fold metallo-hydrolase [Amycolatopsis sp. cmx-11-51]|uniref:MBL fold metallo-hydrolase n=1 Tax=unclassified Amycolatopsis TaxID=2618356 RepID=UPI0039E23312
MIPVAPEMTERPADFVAPNLSPVGLELHPVELGEGVHALMANEAPKDNNGLIIGKKAALIIDSGVTPRIGRHIQDIAAGLTDTPIRYLVNTTYHGDHTFGNTAFDAGVRVISSRMNKAAMSDLAAEKNIRSESMYGAEKSLDDVVSWRLPDVTFDRYCEIDLGGRIVQLWHFGSANGPGDTLVHVPDAKVTWTGNFISPGMPPMMLIGDPVAYLRTVRAMRATLTTDTLVPGHAFIGEAEPSISILLGYLENLTTAVHRGREAGRPVEALYEELPMWGITTPAGAPEQIRAVLRSLHRLNILTTYRWMDGQRLRAA